MKLTFAKAEHLKRNATKAEDPKKIFQSMKPVFSDFAGELQRSLGFFSNTHRQAQIKQVVGLGNAFRLPGLQKFLSQTLGLEVQKIESFQRLKGDEVTQSPVYTENILSFTVAYGLALQGLGLTRLRTNLLPQEIQFERLIRSKKPWVAVAAASMLVGTGVFGLFSGFNYSTAFAANEEANGAKSVMARAADYERKFKDEQKRMQDAREQAQAILRGAEERTNWAVIHRYINECLPQPDSWNLPPNVYNKYWTDAARRAYIDKKARDEEGRKEETNLSELIQINTQSVYARYCGVPECTNVFNYVKKMANDQEPLTHLDWTKPPSEAGWWLEVRGYTYHKDGLNFIRSTFLENLRTRKMVLSPLNDPSAHPLKLDVSHAAILAQHAAVLTPTDTPGFKYISSGLYLNEAVKGGGSTTGTTTGGQTGAGGGSGAIGIGESGGGGGAGAGSARRQEAWTGLGSALGATGSLGGGPGGGIDRGGGYPGTPGIVGSGGGGGSMMLPGGPAGGGSTGVPGGGNLPEPTLKAGERKRTEFVILFYWREPLPSEPKDAGGDQNATLEATDSNGGRNYPGAPEGTSTGYPSYPSYPGGGGGGMPAYPNRPG
jgi:hypothetical protein